MAKPKSPGGRRPGRTSAPRAAQATTAAATSAATVTVDPPKPKVRTSPAQFISQVRAEGRKISWPSRKETWITSVMVFIMVLLAAAFFWIVDTVLGFASQWILGLGQ